MSIGRIGGIDGILPRQVGGLGCLPMRCSAPGCCEVSPMFFASFKKVFIAVKKSRCA